VCGYLLWAGGRKRREGLVARARPFSLPHATGTRRTTPRAVADRPTPPPHPPTLCLSFPSCPSRPSLSLSLSLSLSRYYTREFHCYPAGNLTWDAALEVEASARAVHAPVMDPRPNGTLSPDGDAALRAGISGAARSLMTAAGVDPDALTTAVDVGCSTGLSSRELARAFKGLEAITGVDLSPHMLAVGRHLSQKSPLPRSVSLTLLHAPFEGPNSLPSSSFDLVNIVLVHHELPRSVSGAMVAEAWRVLRPGGVLVCADMDPSSPPFARLMASPFAYAGFKSSEPHLLEWVALGLSGLAGLAAGMGFVGVGTGAATPRHGVVVAVKPNRRMSDF
jgi:SAM-dependent methyltransferase